MEKTYVKKNAIRSVKRKLLMCNPVRVKPKAGRTILSAIALGLVGQVGAVELSASDADISINWDNTLRYTFGTRVQEQDSKIMNNPVFGADSDALFKRGENVTNRVDWLSELDVVYKKDFGFRISGAAWDDSAYDTQPKNALGLPTNYINNKFSSIVNNNYHRGSEILDAFIFGKFEANNIPISLKAGRQVNYWGESLFSAFTGVNYGQAPIDVKKALSNPGAQAKELFMPLNQISGQAQITNELSVASYYGLEWAADRLPDGGTYFGDIGFLFDGPDYFAVGAPGGLSKLQPLKGRNTGDWGVNVRWSPGWLDGTMGFVYRKFDEKLPWAQIGVTGADYRQVFAQDTKLAGLTLSKSIGGASVGAELVYMKNAALYSTGFSGAATDNQAARGDMLNGVVNSIWYFGKNSLWDSASLVGELTWNHLVSVNLHPELYKGEGYASCANLTVWDDCSTKNAFAGTVAFAPTWSQVAPSLDLAMPMSISLGLSGNGANNAGPNQGAGSYSIGVSGLYKSKYSFALKYNGYLVHTSDNGTAVTTFNAKPPGLLSDRGWISFTASASF